MTISHCSTGYLLTLLPLLLSVAFFFFFSTQRVVLRRFLLATHTLKSTPLFYLSDTIRYDNERYDSLENSNQGEKKTQSCAAWKQEVWSLFSFHLTQSKMKMKMEMKINPVKGSRYRIVYIQSLLTHDRCSIWGFPCWM